MVEAFAPEDEPAARASLTSAVSSLVESHPEHSGIYPLEEGLEDRKSVV